MCARILRRSPASTFTRFPFHPARRRTDKVGNPAGSAGDCGGIHVADSFDHSTDELGDGPAADVAHFGAPQTFMPGTMGVPPVGAPAPPTAPPPGSSAPGSAYAPPTYAPPAYGQYLPPQQITYESPPPNRRGLWITLGTVGAVILVVIVGFATGVISVSKKGPSTAANPDAATGVSYTSPDNHFTAKFPATPETGTVPSSVGTITLSTFVARAASPLTIVGDETLTNGTLPTTQYGTTLRVGLSSFAAGANATVDSQDVTTFRGHPARTGTVTMANGPKLTVTLFVYSNTSVYILAAEKGTAYDNLVKSFQVLEPDSSSS